MQFKQALQMRLRRFAVVAAAGVLLCAILFGFDRAFPLPDFSPARDSATVVIAADGTPLRAFANDEGVWRYPVTPEQVAPEYLSALINYEDRWFYQHPGVNPVALLRAAWQWLTHGRIVSGGSTLTMQVARFLRPQTRSLSGKLQQILRALQLEWHCSKRTILTLYLNYAPFGGPLEGVQAASFAYLGKPAAVLSPAEGALLAVLPQAPTRLRPDRKPLAAQAARNKVLRRLQQRGVVNSQTLNDALAEPVLVSYQPRPWIAPHLSERLKGDSRNNNTVISTIDTALQLSIEAKLRANLGSWPQHTSAAVLVVENATLAVRGYAGSADFFAADRAGQVDMISATRSPGSTLKPFLYAFALEDGLIHSESLLSDVPRDFSGYQPANFSDTFNGPVSAREALQRSLNVPAVDLLDHYGATRFAARLRQAGVKLEMGNASPNLSLILGGAGTSLEDLVAAYAGLANGGLAGPLRFTPSASKQQTRFVDAGAAWIVRNILEQQNLPGFSNTFDSRTNQTLAWKTGTSYGFRDAWAVGFNDTFTIGVWVGRPDGTPSPGSYGAVTAAPLLFAVEDSLLRTKTWPTRAPQPDNVHTVEICWPTGAAFDPQRASLCHVKRHALTLNDTLPLTLPEPEQSTWHNGIINYWVDPKSARRVDAHCDNGERQARETAVWPLALEPWLPANWRRHTLLPQWDPHCSRYANSADETIRIAQQPAAITLHRAGASAAAPAVTLSTLGNNREVYWLVNGRLIQTASTTQTFTHRFDEAGDFTVTVMDRGGRYDSRFVRVLP